jgi:excisionase family DNA binding protein
MEEHEELDFVTMREAADIMRLKGTEAIRKAIERKELPAVKMGHRHILIPREAFVRWVMGKKMRPLAARVASSQLANGPVKDTPRSASAGKSRQEARLAAALAVGARRK